MPADRAASVRSGAIPAKLLGVRLTPNTATAWEDPPQIQVLSHTPEPVRPVFAWSAAGGMAEAPDGAPNPAYSAFPCLIAGSWLLRAD